MMDKDDLLDSVKTRGWAIVRASDPGLAAGVRDGFLDAIRKRGIDFDHMDDLRSKLLEMSKADYNQLRAITLAGLSSGMAEAFAGPIAELCGGDLFLQRRPHLNVNMPGRKESVTPPHIELLSGHSPYSLVLWMPLHDIEDESGLFCWDLDESHRFMLAQKNFETAYDQEELWSVVPPPLKMKFGEAVVFNNFVMHGAKSHSSSLGRISVDIRFQGSDRMLYEKNIDYFSYYSLS